MTDHRATDLSYGHLGEASYDKDEQSWYFTSDTSLDSSIRPLLPIQEYISPSFRVTPTSYKSASVVRQEQERWLQNALPEAGPAVVTITSSVKETNQASSTQKSSTLLAVGRAFDVDQTTGTKSTQIMVMACGEAGNQLRLIKPRVEALKWDGGHDTKLRTINPVAGEDCYWSAGYDGAIHHITFGADTNGVTSWLAVLKPDSITILRPLYHRVQIPSLISTDSERKYPPSRLSPNPILKLTNATTGGMPYADVSFNPWYIRQFAVVDQQGYWCVWDIEGQRRKRTTFEAKFSKSGHIQDDTSQDEGFRHHENADGWGRILWAGGASTLIICNRRDIAIFDLKAAPKRLYSPKVVHPNSADWILDVRRSSVNLNHIFVLTTRQIFWLQVMEAGEGQDELFSHAGAKILLSCKHFRNQEDEKAKLELLEENEECTVLLYSPQSPLVNTYRFSMAMEASTMPICSRDSFIVEQSHGDPVHKPFGLLQALCLLSTTFMLPKLKPLSGPAMQYVDHNIRFYQLFGLSETLGLYHTLCATKWTAPRKLISGSIEYHSILAPTIKDRRLGKIRSSLLVADDEFIVPDGFEEEEDGDLDSFDTIGRALSKHTSLVGRHSKVQDNTALSVDARRLFIASFFEMHSRGTRDSASSEEHPSMVEYSKDVQSALEERKSLGLRGLVTLPDLVEYTSFSEDVDEAASALQDLMNAIKLAAEDSGTMEATLLTIRPSALIESAADIALRENLPSLSHAYDKLVELWVSCLPENTPGPIRLAKDKLVRDVATELCLSSLGVLIRDKAVALPKSAELHEETAFVLPVRTKPDSANISTAKSPETSHAPFSSIPTPIAAPTPQSSENSSTLPEPAEDEAISRLRSYTISIKSQPPLGASRSAILTHWPSTPGSDPSKYSWEASRQSVVENEEIQSDEEEALARQREQDHRRRRTEKFLKRQRVNTINATSQPAPSIAFGSQPGPTEQSMTSQSTEVPMTQPDRGAFGSRLGPKGFKKRRTMGF